MIVRTFAPSVLATKALYRNTTLVMRTFSVLFTPVKQVVVEKQAYEGDVLYPRYAREEQRTLVALCDEKQKPYAVIECR